MPTLLRLAAPNILVMVAQAAVGLIETYFVGKLGLDALAGMALVFPIVMLIQMTLGRRHGRRHRLGHRPGAGRAPARRRQRAGVACAGHRAGLRRGVHAGHVAGRALAVHTDGAAAPRSKQALTYSHWVFAGSVLVWLFNSLSAVIRGTGNMAVPANVTVAGVVVLVPLSPLLIFGWGPLPGLGIAGGALALLLYYLVGSLALIAYLRSPRSLLRPTLDAARLRWPLFVDILRVGLVGAVSTVATNLAIGITTALAGHFGPSAIAGYGTASRLEYLLVPLVFGLGAPLVAMVGTCIGAGQRERALRATWAGAAIAFVLAESIGVAAALFPRPWLMLFGSDPAMLDTGAQYLRVVGPVYGFFGVGLVLYFASQGAGRLLWPVIGNLARLLVAAIGGWLALRWGGSLAHIFAAQGVALVVYGVVIASAIAGGAWFGRVGWPRTTSGLLRRLSIS